jgi:hypothetical protein
LAQKQRAAVPKALEPVGRQCGREREEALNQNGNRLAIVNEYQRRKGNLSMEGQGISIG